MKIAVFYFSGTGSTWWTMSQFQDIAEKNNHIVEIFNIEKAKEFDVREIVTRNEIIGFAYPIYGSDIPKIMKNFLTTHFKNIDLQGKIPVLVINTMLLFSGDGALIIRKYINESNFELRWILNIILNSNISIPGFRVNPIPQKKLEKRMLKAKIPDGSILLRLV